jgi:Glycosyl transferase family 2
MRLVATLVVRDEADVADEQVAYHLAAGADFVLATDHDSWDGTTEILEDYERRGVLRLFRERGEMREAAWRTSMARLAATEHEADWVINTDADEFWLPRGGTLKDVLAAVPERFGIVWGLSRHFVPRPDDGRSFAERMTVRIAQHAPLNDPTGPYRPHAKAAHRADPNVGVRFGAHLVTSEMLQPLHGWHPADVLHFPFRSVAQYERKTVRRARGDKPLGQYVKGMQASEAGEVEAAYEAIAADDLELERGLSAGSLVVDTRLRDALRALREGSPLGPTAPEPTQPIDASAWREADVVRLARRLDGLTVRVDRLEGLQAMG